MSEWANDKLLVLSEDQRITYVLTGLNSNTFNTELIKYFHVPSLSWRDFNWEIKELKKSSKKLPLRVYIFYPIPFLFGRLFDLITRSLLTENSAARWSWALSSFPIAMYLKIRFSCREVFCTGGATGGHLLGLFLSFFPKSEIYFEFQDPLLGTEMKRSATSTKAISKLESLIIRRSKKTIYVTKTAAEKVRERNPFLSCKILSIYPGSWKYSIKSYEFKLEKIEHEINLIHLGTLYGNRNLDNFFKAIDNLKSENYLPAFRIRVLNLGAIYLDNSDEYYERKDFSHIEPMDRQPALEFCSKMDALLLIQHTDTRSQETIPYKVYDYFNLNMPIMGLINNSELSDMLNKNNSLVVDNNSINAIANGIKELVNQLDNKSNIFFNQLNFDIREQFNSIFR